MSHSPVIAIVIGRQWQQHWRAISIQVECSLGVEDQPNHHRRLSQILMLKWSNTCHPVTGFPNNLPSLVRRKTRIYVHLQKGTPSDATNNVYLPCRLREISQCLMGMKHRSSLSVWNILVPHWNEVELNTIVSHWNEASQCLMGMRHRSVW